ncbi:hypothetical protein GCM10023313_09470 [Mucilaginibacter defluvii]|uniref:Uncharacterized protein n=1 Tax=Mucilaginibacter defluvii TaxID=1196019 RepID=A0ABP9FNB0_9SPHI
MTRFYCSVLIFIKTKKHSNIILIGKQTQNLCPKGLAAVYYKANKHNVGIVLSLI